MEHYKKYILSLCLMLTISPMIAQNLLDNLLKTYVDSNGNVNYSLLSENREALTSAIESLKANPPEEHWTALQEKAYWINVYNAYTLEIVVAHYPLKSITEISKKGKTAWKHPFVVVGNTTYTLDYIEHEILRKKFKDPRIHVGVNCASISCPKLANFAFTAENIESSLERLMKDFINDPSKNKITQKKVQLNEIFNWFKDDFIQDESLISYLNKYAKTQIDNKAKIRYLSYNWGLNSK